MRRLLTLAIFTTGLVLAGCGFHLRGSDAVSPALQPLYIGGNDAEGPLGQAIKRQLRLRSTELSDNLASASYQLILLERERERRILSLDPRANAAELSLTETASFELRDARGQVVLGPITIEERRVMVDDPNRRVDKDTEASTLHDEMVDDLAARILRRLRAFDPSAPRNTDDSAAASHSGS